MAHYEPPHQGHCYLQMLLFLARLYERTGRAIALPIVSALSTAPWTKC